MLAADPRAELWHATRKGEHNRVMELLNTPGLIADINEQYQGQTLLHALVSGDSNDRHKFKEDTRGSEYARIARELLARGADMHIPADRQEGISLVNEGETPYDMAAQVNSETTLYEVARKSVERWGACDLAYTGEHVWGALKEHRDFPRDVLRKQVGDGAKQCLKTSAAITVGALAVTFLYYCGPSILKALTDDIGITSPASSDFY